jgi:hypothetical protein
MSSAASAIQVSPIRNTFIVPDRYGLVFPACRGAKIPVFGKLRSSVETFLPESAIGISLLTSALSVYNEPRSIKI